MVGWKPARALGNDNQGLFVAQGLAFPGSYLTSRVPDSDRPFYVLYCVQTYCTSTSNEMTTLL